MEDKIDEEKYIIDDEILNQRVEPLRQKMKNGEISFDEYTNQYNKLYLERYNEIKSNQEENIKSFKSNIPDIKTKKHNILLIFVYIFLICCIAGIIFVYISHRLRMQNEYNNTNINTAITYKCLDEYELINNKCYKAVDTTNINIDYTCQNGYNLSNDKCIKYEYDNKITADWNCPDGYTMGKEKYPDICYKTITIPTELEYYCTNGYTLSGTKCIKDVSTNPRIDYVCQASGATPFDRYDASQGICIMGLPTKSCYYPMYIYERINDVYVRCAYQPTIYKTCEAGTEKVNNMCVTKIEEDAKSVWACPIQKYPNAKWNINSERTECTATTYETPSYEIRCEKSGYVYKDKNCIKTITIEANKKTHCPDGYELKDNNCIKFDIQEPTIIEE